MTPEILARLTPGSLDPSRIRYSGGIPEHTAGEIAGALAHCSEGARLYASVFYCGADEYRGWLMSEIRLKLAEIWEKRGWRIRAPGILQGLAWLAIVEEEPANTRCPKCNGAKGLELQDRVCQTCYGTGNQRKYKCSECDGSGKQTISCALCNGSGIRGIAEETRVEVVRHCLEPGHDVEWDREIQWQYEAVVRPILSDYNGEIWGALGRNLEVDGDFL